VFVRNVHQLLVTAKVVTIFLIILMMEVIRSSDTSVLTSATCPDMLMKADSNPDERGSDLWDR
jgi:hypothetical protein